MHQFTLRLSDELARQLKRAAADHGRSVNAYCQAVLEAATDPAYAGADADKLRERLARAGLLAPPGRPRRRPARAEVERARRAAGRGRPLADIVAADR